MAKENQKNAKMTYKVIITKKHCINGRYSDTKGCPLFLAIREQLPDFDLEGVGGVILTSKNGDYYRFNSSGKKGWNTERMDEILHGIIDSHTVEFTLR